MSCSLSVSTLRLISSACRRCSSLQSPCRSMKPRVLVTCTSPGQPQAGGTVEDAVAAIQVDERGPRNNVAPALTGRWLADLIAQASRDGVRDNANPSAKGFLVGRDVLRLCRGR